MLEIVMVKNVTSIATKKPLFSGFSTSREIRTLVLTLKGLRPGPLDDGGIKLNGQYSNRRKNVRQEICEKS